MDNGGDDDEMMPFSCAALSIFTAATGAPVPLLPRRCVARAALLLGRFLVLALI